MFSLAHNEMLSTNVPQINVRKSKVNKKRETIKETE